MPRVCGREDLNPDDLTFKRWRLDRAPAGATLWLFVLPSCRVIVVLSVDVECTLIETIDLLEDCYFGDVRIDGATLESLARDLLARRGNDFDVGDGLPPERHQLVFGYTPDPSDCEEVTQRLIYRADLPYRKEFSAIHYPPELNRRPGWLTAVGPYVSVIGGHADFIQNTIFLSAVQAVGAATELREIRQSAYGDVKLFRSSEQIAASDTQQRRRILERIANNLSELELELSYSVEATADLGLLVPSLRVESFHIALYESMGLAAKAQTTGRMLQRLERAISAELTAVESIERRADEERRVRWTIAIGFLSTIAVPAGVIFGYFGINASQVNPQRSMFDHRYAPMYLTVASLIVLGVLLFLGLYVHQTGRIRRSDAERSRY